MMFNNFLLVGIGGAIGSMLRFGTAQLIGVRSLPLATLTVNIVGSFLIGILFGLSSKNNLSDYSWKFFAVGICGGFTTFSSLSLEGLQLIHQQRFFVFLLYFTGSIVAGLAATYIGYIIAK